jgi:hypothetical protein
MTATDSIDLWTPRYPIDRLHPHFRVLAATPRRDCITRWANDFIDVNHNIVHEFQTKFSPAFWELYLNAMFKSLEFGVSRPADRPDFVLDAPQGLIAAEAKVTEAGPGQVAELVPKCDVPYDREQFYAQTSAKLQGAIDAKMKSYRAYANEQHVKDRPFLLCLNPYDHPWFVVQGFGAITRVLYQYCDPTCEIGEGGTMIETGHRRVESFATRGGATVAHGLFLDPRNADISAIFFNPRATVNKLMADALRESRPGERVCATWYMVSSRTCIPQNVHPSYYRETLADGGYLLLNPYATHSIHPEPFLKQGVAVCNFDPQRRVLHSRTPEPFLKERVTVGAAPDELAEDGLREPRAKD